MPSIYSLQYMSKTSIIEKCKKAKLDYHKKIRTQLMQIEAYLAELAEKESTNRDAWAILLKKFQSIGDALSMHMGKEEALVIHYIEQLDLARREGTEIPTTKFPNLNVPLEFIKIEHEEILNKLIDFQSATLNLRRSESEPSNKALSNKVLLAIQQFQTHISLAMDFETQELFKEAINLENDLNDTHRNDTTHNRRSCQ